MANHPSHAALPFPVKNARFTLGVGYLDADGDPTDPVTPDTEIAKDAGAFADCVEEVTTITGTNGTGYITLTGAEMDASLVQLAFKVASGPKSSLIPDIRPRVLPVIFSGTASAGAAGSLTLATDIPAVVDLLVGCILKTTGGTGGGGAGGANNQARVITDFTTGRVASVVPNWETTPDGTTTYEVLLTEMAYTALANLVLLRGTEPNVLISGRLDANAQIVADKSGYSLTTGEEDAIVDKVWDEARSAHIADGSMGQAMALIRSGTAQAGAAATITLDAGASASDDFFNSQVVQIVSGTGAGQSRLIRDYTGSTKVADVVPNWVTNPDATSVFIVRPASRADIALWLGEAVNVLISGRVNANAQAVGDKTGYSVGSGGITSASFAAGAIDAVAIATDAIGSAEFSQAAADKVFGSGGATLAELAQAIPPATPRPDQALMLLYMALRNRVETTSTVQKLHNDGLTVIAKATLSDDGTTFRREELVAGP